MLDLFAALTPGTRVVVRHRLPAPETGVSDALGDFLGIEWPHGVRSVRVRTRHGDVIIATRAITHAKPVPPPPPRRRRTPGS